MVCLRHGAESEHGLSGDASAGEAIPWMLSWVSLCGGRDHCSPSCETWVCNRAGLPAIHPVDRRDVSVGPLWAHGPARVASCKARVAFPCRARCPSQRGSRSLALLQSRAVCEVGRRLSVRPVDRFLSHRRSGRVDPGCHQPREHSCHHCHQYVVPNSSRFHFIDIWLRWTCVDR